jgi:hypothetical protein
VLPKLVTLFNLELGFSAIEENQIMEPWDNDATTDEIIGYIDECCSTDPYPFEINLRFENTDEAIGCIEGLAVALRKAKLDFVSAVQNHQSTTALFEAYTFKHLLSFHDQLLEIVRAHDLKEWGSVREIDFYRAP